MSTILKALRRVEEEKTAPVGRRPLREEVAHGAEAPRPRRGAWALAVAALVSGVAVGVALLTLWPPRSAPPQPPEPRVARAPAPPPARSAPARRPAEPQGLPDAALSSPVEVVARPRPKPLVVDEPGAATGERVLERAAPDASPAPAVASPPPRSARAAAPEPQRTSAAPPALPDAAATWAASEADAPPEVASAPAPGIRVEQTFWHPSRERRVAVLKLPGREQPVRVHEGDAIEGLVVSEIEPSGVVFTQEGRQVRHALGASR